MTKTPVFLRKILKWTGTHSAEILTGLGIAGGIATTVLAVKATPKAMRLIRDEERSKTKDIPYTDRNARRTLTPLETVKVAWKPYIPAVLTGAASVACILGASSKYMARNAALAAAYDISRTALVDYREKVTETVGAAKEKTIREQVAQKKIDQAPVSSSEVVVIDGKKVLFREPVSGRYFTSDIESVRKVINDLNFRLTSGMEEYISLSDLYDGIGLSHTKTSDDLGWNLGRDGQISMKMPAGKTENGEPCLVLDYDVFPRYDYTTLY